MILPITGLFLLPPTPALRRPGLVKPTAKALGALTVAAAAAIGLGVVAGLPSPTTQAASFEQGASRSAAVPLAGGVLSAGTPLSLAAGPFHPVAGPYYYGETAARFGSDRGGRRHEGQDIFARKGTPLVATVSGVVVSKADDGDRFSSGRGNYLAIYDPQAERSHVYLHMLQPTKLAVGEKVRAGQVVGLMGCTGSCDGVHLHYEIRRGKATLRSELNAIDPLPFLRKLTPAPAAGPIDSGPSRSVIPRG